MSKELTVAEIKETLDAFEIEYDDKANKKELQSILDANTVEGKEQVEEAEYYAVTQFRDLDSGIVYEKGHDYPHKNADKPSKKRIKELSTINNKLNKVLIKKK